MQIELSDQEGQESREVANLQATEGEQVGDLVAMAINRNLDTDKLQALIDMRNAQEEREAKRRFDDAFTRMKAEFAPVERSKATDKSKYAPIEAMQMQFDPIIHKHGFSYWWNEEPQPDGGIVITMTISGHGHAKQNSKYLPKYEPDKSSSGKSIMNSLQAEGVRSSYGRRYTFIAGFGITVRDEDTDGRMMSSNEVNKWLPSLTAIKAAENMDQLKEVFFEAYKQTTDSSIQRMLTEAKDDRKRELSNG